MESVYLKLQPSEAEVFQAASRIYSAYLSTNQVSEGQEDQYIEKAVLTAIKLAKRCDEAVVSDDESG